MRKTLVVKKKAPLKKVTTPAAQKRITTGDLVGITADALEDYFIYPEPRRANAEDIAIEISRMILYEEGGTKVVNHSFSGKECEECK